MQYQKLSTSTPLKIEKESLMLHINRKQKLYKIYFKEQLMFRN